MPGTCAADVTSFMGWNLWVSSWEERDCGGPGCGLAQMLDVALLEINQPLWLVQVLNDCHTELQHASPGAGKGVI